MHINHLLYFKKKNLYTKSVFCKGGMMENVILDHKRHRFITSQCTSRHNVRPCHQT
jgi:hypothetical protein